MRFPFPLERYLADLRDRTAWAPDYPLETLDGPRIPRPALYRMAHLWALSLLDDRFDTLLLPILVTTTLDDVIAQANTWNLSPDYFRERLSAGACLLFVDAPAEDGAPYRVNRAFFAE